MRLQIVWGVLLPLVAGRNVYSLGRLNPHIRPLSVKQTESALLQWAGTEKNPVRQRALLHSVTTLDMLVERYDRDASSGMPICIGVCDPYVSAVTVMVANGNVSSVNLWVLAHHPLRPSTGTALMNAIRRSIGAVHKQHSLAPRWHLTDP
jgi:hypothetical protein